MATLTIRNIPAELHNALRRRAAEHRRSMEAEVRALIADAVDAGPARLSPAEVLEGFRAMNESVDTKPPAGWSVVDEFLAEKRLEAAWEDERVNDEERRDWLQRLQRHEIWPADLEAFVASRTARR